MGKKKGKKEGLGKKQGRRGRTILPHVIIVLSVGGKKKEEKKKKGPMATIIHRSF